MKKLVGLLVTMLSLLLCLVGCGKTADAKVSTIIIEKNGAVTGIVIEDFSQPYYEETQMRETVDAEVKAYNDNAGSERVKVEALSVENNIAKLSMWYKSAEDYAEFNGQTLFVGTIEEAIAAGYDMKVTLVESENSDNAIEEEGILALKEKRIVISEEPVRIRLFNKAKYISPDAAVSNAKEIDTYNVQGLSYIIL